MKCRLFKIFKKDERGQAVFELLAFLPFLIFIFTVMITIGNAINASINQQKVTRRYHFYLTKGDSYVPAREDLDLWARGNITIAGMSVLGFREKEGASDQSLAPCFKFSTIFSDDSSEACEDKIPGNRSNFLRIYTFYGLCGETYILRGGYYKTYHNTPLASQAARLGSCTLTNQ